MFCQNHPDKPAQKSCQCCHAAFCEVCLPSGELCAKCLAQQAGSQLADDIVKDRADAGTREEGRKKTRKKQKKSILALKVLIILSAVGVVIYQMPEIIDSLKEEKPIRVGTYATGTVADDCIKYLWAVSRDLQTGKLPGPDSVCPGSGQPLKVVNENSDTIVLVPDPQSYGFKGLRVSKKQPVPEIIQ